MTKPYLINFQHTGVAEFGFLDTAEVGKSILLDDKRIFWIHTVPDTTKRGFHAHKK